MYPVTLFNADIKLICTRYCILSPDSRYFSRSLNSDIGLPCRERLHCKQSDWFSGGGADIWASPNSLYSSHSRQWFGQTHPQKFSALTSCSLLVSVTSTSEVASDLWPGSCHPSYHSRYHWPSLQPRPPQRAWPRHAGGRRYFSDIETSQSCSDGCKRRNQNRILRGLRRTFCFGIQQKPRRN